MLSDLLHAAAPTIALIAACMACDGGFSFRPHDLMSRPRAVWSALPEAQITQ